MNVIRMKKEGGRRKKEEGGFELGFESLP